VADHVDQHWHDTANTIIWAEKLKHHLRHDKPPGFKRSASNVKGFSAAVQRAQSVTTGGGAGGGKDSLTNQQLKDKEAKWASHTVSAFSPKGKQRQLTPIDEVSPDSPGEASPDRRAQGYIHGSLTLEQAFLNDAEELFVAANRNGNGLLHHGEMESYLRGAPWAFKSIHHQDLAWESVWSMYGDDAGYCDKHAFQLLYKEKFGPLIERRLMEHLRETGVLDDDGTGKTFRELHDDLINEHKQVKAKGDRPEAGQGETAGVQRGGATGSFLPRESPPAGNGGASGAPTGSRTHEAVQIGKRVGETTRSKGGTPGEASTAASTEALRQGLDETDTEKASWLAGRTVSWGGEKRTLIYDAALAAAVGAINQGFTVKIAKAKAAAAAGQAAAEAAGASSGCTMDDIGVAASEAVRACIGGDDEAEADAVGAAVIRVGGSAQDAGAAAATASLARGGSPDLVAEAAGRAAGAATTASGGTPSEAASAAALAVLMAGGAKETAAEVAGVVAGAAVLATGGSVPEAGAAAAGAAREAEGSTDAVSRAVERTIGGSLSINPDLRMVFNFIDRDGDGLVNPKEMNTALRKDPHLRRYLCLPPSSTAEVGRVHRAAVDLVLSRMEESSGKGTPAAMTWS